MVSNSLFSCSLLPQPYRPTNLSCFMIILPLVPMRINKMQGQQFLQLWGPITRPAILSRRRHCGHHLAGCSQNLRCHELIQEALQACYCNGQNTATLFTQLLFDISQLWIQTPLTSKQFIMGHCRRTPAHIPRLGISDSIDRGSKIMIHVVAANSKSCGWNYVLHNK